MRCRSFLTLTALLSLAAACPLQGADAMKVDDRPGGPGEWGFRPVPGEASPTNPPAFVWRPQKNAVAYEIQVARDKDFKQVAYRAGIERYNCHCPPRTLPEGTHYWRFRFIDTKKRPSVWSVARSFRSFASTKARSRSPCRRGLNSSPGSRSSIPASSSARKGWRT